ncbi:hypothetical protein GALL_490660 [mine drainage metagenome]|uniref:Uncharacterized protein n=1 Tax=mine drainage metagenome TaxID=410659 RepID=A0A1J5PEY9_9ZZZZ
MCLLGLFGHYPEFAHALMLHRSSTSRLRRFGSFSQEPIGRKSPFGVPDDVLVLEVSGYGDDQIARAIFPPVIAIYRRARHTCDRLHAAQNRPAKRSVAVKRLGEEVVNQIARIIITHMNLFKDDAALGIYIGRHNYGRSDEIRNHIDCKRQVLVEYSGIKARVLLTGEGIHLAADRFDRR